jgi:citrate synthase
VDLRTRGQKSADTKAANKLAEEARIKEAINKQLQQQVQQLQKTMQPQPQFNQAVQIPKGQQQSYQPQSRTSEQHRSSEQYRSDMCLDFKMFETAVTSFESFADRRLDKFVSTSK